MIPEDALPWPVVIEWGASARAAVAVGSWPAESLLIESQRCSCGGRFQGKRPTIVLSGRAPLECWEARCRRCGYAREFWFDISSFHNQPAAARRFEELTALLEGGMRCMEEGDLPGAWLRFQEVAAREPWLAQARYQLGMIAMSREELEIARLHLEAAAALTPLEPGVHEALASLWEARGDPERAWRAMLLSQSLEGGESELYGVG